MPYRGLRGTAIWNSRPRSWMRFEVRRMHRCALLGLPCLEDVRPPAPEAVDVTPGAGFRLAFPIAEALPHPRVRK